MKNFYLFIVLILITFAFEGHSQGIKGADPETSQVINNMVGQVVFVKGEVIKLRADNKKEIKIGAANQIVQEGDTVTTGVGSFVKLKMIDDSIISIGPKSRMVFEKFTFKSKDNRQSIYGFISGKIRAHVPVKAKPGDITVKTKTASLGVRGTIFLGNLNTSDKGRDVTQFAVVEGNVRVKNEINGENSNVAKKEKMIAITQGNDLVVDAGTLAINDEEYNTLVSYDDEKSEDAPVFLNDYKEDSLPGRHVSSIGKPEYDSGENPKGNWHDVQKHLNKKLQEYNGH